jgi:sporulation protein YlmC with PRC-barrel domain
MKANIKMTTILCGVALAFGLSSAAAADRMPDSHPSGKLVKGSEVQGAKLFDRAGKNIGQVDDLLFDENSGGMTHAIVAVGGWLGMGDKESAVPWKFVHPSKDRPNEFVLEVDQAKLRQVESYDRNNWPQPDQQWYQKNYSQFGLAANKNAKLVRASTVVGKGDRLTNVPWALVRQSRQNTAGFVVNADKTKLAGAKYFDRNQWPDYTDWGLQTNNYGYYGYKPYWTDPTVYN